MDSHALDFLEDKDAAEIGQKIEDLIAEFKGMNADPDMVSFLLISSGQMLLIANNHNDPAYVTYLSGTALVSAAANVAAHLEKDGRTEH